MHNFSTEIKCRHRLKFLTAMVKVPGELEPVGGEVEVSDLVREDGGVALLPRGDRQVVARRVVTQRDVLHPRQFLCGNFRIWSVSSLYHISMRIRIAKLFFD